MTVTTAASLTGSASDLREILAAYDLGPSPQARLLHLSENATFEIISGEADGPSDATALSDGCPEPGGDRRWVLRLHRPEYHDRAAVHSELAWISALRRDGVVRTPAVIPTRSGGSVVTFLRPPAVDPAGPAGPGRNRESEAAGARHAVLFEWVAGRSPETLEPAALVRAFAQLGGIAARLHLHARSWERPPSFSRFSWTWEAMLGRDGRWGSWSTGLAAALTGGAMREEVELLERAARETYRRVIGYGTGAARFGLVHADMRLANLLIPDVASGDDRADDANGEVCVIDFDDCGFGWYLWDLAASLSFIEHLNVAGDLTDAWLTAYQRQLPLTADDIEMIPTFVMMRRLLLVAWLGTHPHSDAVASRAEYARDTCTLADAYLRGRLLAC
ncbi:phosphotransferase enzyme family protein [Candidatus Frankia nodulisporulans]|uniref:phosphotransferase enzyme family protein n=1 Tax=Candidatus Frankia nodulisporulans TaxID=2060052 RepID=UPI0013D2F22E|nr:phosphotransferase [Candidatus Frankia nodulisporulans]